MNIIYNALHQALKLHLQKMKNVAIVQKEKLM